MMRTTLTLEPDVAQALQEVMAKGHTTFKRAVNDTLRAGLAARKPARKKRFRVEPYSCQFLPGVDQNKLGQFLDELEAREVVEKLGW
jgi:hypothetical protein